MSVPMLNAVYSSQVMRGLTAAERVVYQYLVFRYNDATGLCNCPTKTIADQCGFGDGNRRNVARIVNALIRKGYLSRQAHRYRNGEGYCYVPTATPDQSTGVKVTPVDNDGQEYTTGVKMTPHGGQGNPQQVSRQPSTGVKATLNRCQCDTQYKRTKSRNCEWCGYRRRARARGGCASRRVGGKDTQREIPAYRFVGTLHQKARQG